MSAVSANYLSVQKQLSAAAEKSGRDPADVLLLAVSKTFPGENIMELYNIGVRHFGENRIPELESKKGALPEDIVWHFIGPLQSNKVRKAVRCASVIHSVESISLLEKIERIAGEEGKTVDILLEVNVSGEASKGGVAPEDLDPLAAAAVKCKNIRFAGLMTMAPLSAEQDELEKIFSTLAALKSSLEKKYAVKLEHLSMGMSGDFETAVACGSTIIRIGTAIFAGK